MMKIYEGPFLVIHFERKNNRFVQFWTSSPNNTQEFKSEMLTYTSYYRKHKPTQTLWLQKNFTLDLNSETQIWIEKEVNIPCVNYGNKKAAFVVGKDVLSHLSVINSFEETNSIVRPSHFATEQEALDWLNSTPAVSNEQAKTEIRFEGVDKEGNSIIKVKSPSNDITNTIKSFRSLIEENEFFKTNIDNYILLTKREKEVLALYAKGYKHQAIADKLHLSLYTVRTHWRNAKNKLDIKSFSDLMKYVAAFNLI